MEQFFPLILLALAAVLLFVLPARQRKRAQAQTQALQDSLTVGTPVMTTSGLHGTVDLEIAPGVVVTFARQAILEVRRPAGSVEAGGEDNTGETFNGPAGGRPADGAL